MSNKKKLESFEVVNLTKECPTLATHFENALCDLGANINIMSYFVLRNLACRNPNLLTFLYNQSTESLPTHST
ncbi:hypothetical protein CR513_39866, partial [Mucuna pruriens]